MIDLMKAIEPVLLRFVFIFSNLPAFAGKLFIYTICFS